MGNNYRSVLASGGGVQPTGDAVAADVLTGKTFSNANAVGIAGSMPNNGAVSGTASPTTPYIIPEGYHNGLGTVSASASGAYTAFTPQGKSSNVFGTNFTVGKYYLLRVLNLSDTYTITGGTEKLKAMIDSVNGYLLVEATASTITVGTAGIHSGETVGMEFTF